MKPANENKEPKEAGKNKSRKKDNIDGIVNINGNEYEWATINHSFENNLIDMKYFDGFIKKLID